MEALTHIILPIFLGAVAMACIEVLRRFILNSKAVSPLQLLISWYATTTVLFGIYYLARWGLTLPTLLGGFWRALFGCVIANLFIQLFNVLAASYDEGEIGRTKPIQSLTPGLITVLGLAFGEWPGLSGWFGILCIMFASYIFFLGEGIPLMLPLQRIAWGFGVLRKRFSGNQVPSKEFDTAMVIVLSFGSACLGTVGLLFDGIWTRRSGIGMQGLILGAMAFTAALSAIYGAWYCIAPDATAQHRKGFALFRERTYSLALLGISTAWILHIIFVYPVYNETYVAYVGALKRFSIPMSVLLGFLVFGEKKLATRMQAAVLMVIGAGLIARDGLAHRISKKFERWIGMAVVKPHG